MNKFLVKITAVVLIGLLVVTGLLCLVGFKIGGELGALHIGIFFGLSILVGGSAVMIIYNDSEHREKLSSTALIFAIIICMLLFWKGYGWLNSLSAGNEVKEYKSVVTYVGIPYRSFFAEEVEFENPEGEECKKRMFALPGDGYETGDIINVKERMGGFGYTVYEIKFIEQSPKK